MSAAGSTKVTKCSVMTLCSLINEYCECNYENSKIFFRNHTNLQDSVYFEEDELYYYSFINH